MTNDPVERILSQLDRPVEPRTEFREELLRRLVAELTPGSARSGAIRAAEKRPPKLPARDVLLAAATVVLALGLGIFIYNLRHVTPITPAPAIPSPAPTGQVAPPTLHLAANSKVASKLGSVGLSNGLVWLTGCQAESVSICDQGGGTSIVARVDATTDRVVGKVPGGFSGLAADDSAVWVTDEVAGTLTRYDPRTARVVATISIGKGGHGVAIGEGGVWVADFGAGPTITRVDPQTNRVSAEISVPNALVQRVAVGHGSVWAPSGDGRLFRIDPITNRVTRTITIPPDALDVAVGEGAVWVDINPQLAGGTGQGSVVRVDPTTNRVVATIRVGHSPNGIAAGAGAVFVVNQDDGTLTEIDPRSNSVVGKPLAVGNGPAGIAAGTTALWVANNRDGNVVRVNFSR